MIGTILGHYEITSRLVTGGMGEVYQGTDTKLGRLNPLRRSGSRVVEFRG